jgi:hypothetical protein
MEFVDIRSEGVHMAQRHVVTLTDDLDGQDLSPGTGETVVFGLDGVTYEIDLGTKNAQKLRDAFGTYVGLARRVAGRRTTARGRSKPDVDPAAVRAWARSHKVAMNERGRIPQTVIDQFRAAGN